MVRDVGGGLLRVAWSLGLYPFAIGSSDITASKASVGGLEIWNATRTNSPSLAQLCYADILVSVLLGILPEAKNL